MAFNSLHFLVFFLSVYALYLVLAQRWQNRLLLLASYVFYGSWDWRFIPLLLLSTWISYYSGLKISSVSAKETKLKYLRWTLFLELSLLGVFKYLNFLGANVVSGLRHLGLSIGDFPIKVILPLGISYYTFQAIAYSADVYRGAVPACRDFPDFALFKSFFPILFSGPIERAKNLLGQVQRNRRVTLDHLEKGLFLVLWGLFKKIYISDHVAAIVDASFAKFSTLSGLETWLAAYAFAIQIYCDFSGYTDIARGLGKLLGFELTLNFKLPYIAQNPVDFWRRWHISLSNWFNDYVYNPLFFRVKNIYVALFVTFFLVAFWHGASWNFVVLGIYNGLLLCGYVFLRPRCKTILYPKSVPLRRSVAVLSAGLLLHLNCVGFLFFRAETLDQVRGLVSNLFVGRYAFTESARNSLLSLAFFVLPLMIMEGVQAVTDDEFSFLRAPRRMQFASALAMVYLTALVYLFTHDSIRGGDFIYFQF